MPDFLGHEGSFRGEQVVARRSQYSIVLMGAGSLGGKIAETLARQGFSSKDVARLTVVDRDKVEIKNFGTQNYGRSDVGRAKATQLAQNIYRAVEIKINGVVKNVTDTTIRQIVRGAHLVVDTFDNAESRELVRVTCSEMNIPCLHAGMGTMGYFEVIWNERYEVKFGFDAVANAPCEYPMASNLVTLCVGTTAEVICRYFDEGKRLDVEYWLEPMKSIVQVYE